MLLLLPVLLLLLPSQLFPLQSSKELSWQREKLSLKDEIARLQLAAEEHESQLQLRKKHADEALERITQVGVILRLLFYFSLKISLQLSNEHTVAIADLEAELRKERELSSVYKESMEKAELVAAEIRFDHCFESNTDELWMFTR